MLRQLGCQYIIEQDHISRRLESEGWTALNEVALHKILRFTILQQTSSPIDPNSKTRLIIGIP
ncbi:hypothetical protein BDV36DRAFT_249777, partial [Aspergillus pseudocaelatus]